MLKCCEVSLNINESAGVPLKTKRNELIIVLVLSIAVIFQLGVSATRIWDDTVTSWTTMGKHSLWRSANTYRSERFANFIEFLNAAIPADGKVGLPPADQILQAVSSKPTMQFFLQNRDLEVCKDTYARCILDYLKNGYSAIIMNGVPKDVIEAGVEESQIHIYDENWGVINPKNLEGNPGDPLMDFGGRAEIFIRLIPPFLFVGFITFLGIWGVSYYIPKMDIIPKLALSFGLSIGLFSLIVCILLLITGGILSYWIIIAALIVMIFIAYIYYKKIDRKEISVSFRIDGWQIALILYLVFQLFISIGRAYSSSDDVLIWGVKGYAIAYRSLFEGLREWGTQTTRYTLNIPILIAVFKKLFTETLPESKIVFPLFAFSLWLLIYDFLKRKLSGPIAGLSTLLVVTGKLLFRGCGAPGYICPGGIE
jgi:hypothetical protein